MPVVSRSCTCTRSGLPAGRLAPSVLAVIVGYMAYRKAIASKSKYAEVACTDSEEFTEHKAEEINVE